MFAEARRVIARPQTYPAESRGLGEAATRRMCAGVLIDREFRDELLRGVYNDRSRRAAPSYGFDLVTVLHYAWRGWWLDFCQRCALLTVLAIAAAQVPLDMVIAVCVLAIWHLLKFMPGWADGVLRYYYRGEGIEPDIRKMRTRGKILGSGIAAAFVALALAMLLSLSTSNRSGGASEAWTTKTGLTGAAVILASWAALAATTAVVRILWIRQLSAQDPQPPGRLGRRMKIIDDQQSYPLTIHSGFRPFIGSGVQAVGWSFVQRLIHQKGILSEPDVEFASPPFTANELMSRLREKISSLCSSTGDDDDDDETRLPGLDVADNVFVHGTHAGLNPDLRQEKYDLQVLHELIANAIASPGDVARHYLASRVASWGGEVVTSVFVHLSLQGRTLYLEFATHALLPTRTDYHLVDEPSQTGPGALTKAVIKSLACLPDEMLGTQHVVSAPAQIWAAVRPHQDLTVQTRKRARADIGAAISAREAAATDAEESYFQYQDSLQHSKIIERRLIATVGDFLMERNVDTTEFLQRANAILNKGVINTGSGNVDITGSAIGDEANVTNEASPPSE